jgi:hypothetical protein
MHRDGSITAKGKAAQALFDVLTAPRPAACSAPAPASAPPTETPAPTAAPDTASDSAPTAAPTRLQIGPTDV